MIMRVRALRKAAGMSQNQLAECMGVAQNCVSQWETETALPRTRQLPDLARALNCSIDEPFVPPEPVELRACVP